MKPLYLALAAGLALSGMTALAAPAAAQSVLKIGLQDDPDTLDPVSNWSFVGRHVLQSLCDKIVDIDTEGKIVPMLATSWEWNADSTALTLKLRNDVVFHDGTKMDAAAIKYNLDRELTMKISRRKAEISAVSSVDVVDPLTVKINLKEPSVPLLAALSDRAGMIVSPKAAEALGEKFTDAPVCSGPYKFVERVTQDRIVLAKFDKYYNADQYHFDQLVYRGMPDSNVRLLNLRSGQLDLIERLAATDVEAVKADKALAVAPVVGLGYYGITFDITGEGADLDAGKKAAIREAFSLAIDRDAINNVVFEGQFTTGNQPFPPASPYYDKNFPVPARDLGAAKKKMAEAGVKAVDLELLVPTDAERQQVAQLIQAMVAEIGIKVSIKPTELMTLLDIARQGKFESHLVGWSGRVDPDLNITPMLACGAAGNDAHYCNKELDTILTKARAIGDMNARKVEYSKAIAILLKDLPLVYLYHSQWIFAHNSNITGLKPAPDGIIRLTGVSRKK
ncbi:Dipeptide-binding protein (plasmid) [Neorhizobium galegae bv. officinalis bv. officinalis str. HAMBI 1141]|uniref:Dipeptide-binding protein n=1 Tax=Neorhizobium galegae bv. officinalis bv. officinalis str. HAMBI 1141 TaxID=1028801 RepID=A0A068TGM5_NEOGA|nr:ABC transporter substrate-binding protein [Neorhizobium galegae]CDN57216.1 Dipeptide-binding protein [Neorhizobium galegae bv. officinalis bv. officinalis str. HAMBI 1141]